MYDFFVGHPSEQHVFSIRIRMETNDIGSFPVARTLDTLASFCTP